MSDGAAASEQLREARDLTRALADALERERGLIAAHGAPEAFEALAEEKLGLLGRLEALGPWNRETTDDSPEWAALRASLEDLHRLNERNGIAIARVLGALRDELALLTGQDRNAETYRPGGAQSGSGGRMHTRA